MKPQQNHRPQVAALPVRLGIAGLEVMLITSRETGRWLIPKGWPVKGLKDHVAAALEAIEEAGIKGSIAKRPLGAYTYQKRLPRGPLPCRVMVYRLDVETECDEWLESGQRTRQWFSPEQAAQLVTEPGLASIIAGIDSFGDREGGAASGSPGRAARHGRSVETANK